MLSISLMLFSLLELLPYCAARLTTTTMSRVSRRPGDKLIGGVCILLMMSSTEPPWIVPKDGWPEAMPWKRTDASAPLTSPTIT